MFSEVAEQTYYHVRHKPKHLAYLLCRTVFRFVKHKSSLSAHCSTGTISTPSTYRAASASVLCAHKRGGSQRFDERTGSVQRESVVHPCTYEGTHSRPRAIPGQCSVGAWYARYAYIQLYSLAASCGRLHVGDAEARRRQRAEAGRRRAKERTVGSVGSDYV